MSGISLCAFSELAKARDQAKALSPVQLKSQQITSQVSKTLKGYSMDDPLSKKDMPSLTKRPYYSKFLAAFKTNEVSSNHPELIVVPIESSTNIKPSKSKKEESPKAQTTPATKSPNPFIALTSANGSTTYIKPSKMEVKDFQKLVANTIALDKKSSNEKLLSQTLLKILKDMFQNISISSFPLEMLKEIFSYLSIQELVRTKKTCKLFDKIIVKKKLITDEAKKAYIQEKDKINKELGKLLCDYILDYIWNNEQIANSPFDCSILMQKGLKMDFSLENTLESDIVKGLYDSLNHFKGNETEIASVKKRVIEVIVSLYKTLPRIDTQVYSTLEKQIEILISNLWNASVMDWRNVEKISNLLLYNTLRGPSRQSVCYIKYAG